MKMLGYSAKDEFKSFGKEIIHKNTFKKQIPNLLTIFRAVSPIFIIPMALSNNILGATIMCFITAFTDSIDGFLARRFDAVTQFGKDLDAFCDKIFVLGITIPLLLYNLWYLIILFFEGMISLINMKYRSLGITESSYIGKYKTWSLFALLCFSYLEINNNIPKGIISSLFTFTAILQIAAIYGYLNTYKKKK